MAYSTQTAVSDGSLSVLPLSIDYLSRDDITVYLGGVPATKDVAWSWVGTTDRSIQFTPAVPNGVTATVKRSTGVNSLYHKFSGGAQFTSRTLDESLTQTLYVAQEFSEATGVAGDTIPQPVGAVGAAGTSQRYSRADHVHVGPTAYASGLVVAPEAGLPAVSTGGTVQGALSWLSSLISGFAAAAGSTLVGFVSAGGVLRTVQAKLRDTPSPLDYGALGDGVTDDSGAFAALQVYCTGRNVDLAGRAYKVTSIPRGNRYTNGRWVLAKTTTISGTADPYSYFAPATLDAGDSYTISPVALARTGLSSSIATYTRPDNHQGIAVDDVGDTSYVLYVGGTPEVSYVATYQKTGGAATATSLASAQLGHQGLTLEQNQSSVTRLWGSVRWDATLYPQGHLQVMRFRVGADATALTNVEVYTLFGAEFSYTGHSTMPSISYDQKYLIATGRKNPRDFWVRVFLLKDLVDGGPGDYSSKWVYEWNVDREVLADDGGDSALSIASEFTPIQNIACDSGAVYILAGNSNLTPNRIHTYSLQGVRQSSSDRVSVGLTEAKAVASGTEYEPEALVFSRPDKNSSPVLCMSVQYGVHGALTTSLFAFGFKGGTSINWGRFTPTATVVTNVAAATPFSCHYAQINTEVVFSGRINLDPTATGYCEVRLSLPLNSNLSSLTDAIGTLTMIGVSGLTVQPDTGAIEGDTTNKCLVLKWISTDTANRAFYFSGMYELK